MKRSDAFPSKYLSKDDIHGPTVGIIDHLEIETLGQGEESENKPVMYFSSGVPKPMVINNTNWFNVEAIYGDESDAWHGKRIEVWFDPSVSFGGKRVGGLRLREPVKNGGDLATATGLVQRWRELREQALALGLPVGDPDPAASDADIIAAGKALRAKIDEAKTEAF